MTNLSVIFAALVLEINLARFLPRFDRNDKFAKRLPRTSNIERIALEGKDFLPALCLFGRD